MKKVLLLALGMGLVLSLGIAYAEEGAGGAMYPSEKMIRDDDLQRLNLDQDRSTVNQVPSESGAEGSAAGGVTAEPERGGTDIEQSKETVEKIPAVPGKEGTAPGGVREEPENTGTDIEQGKEPVEKIPVQPGEEGTGKTPGKSLY